VGQSIIASRSYWPDGVTPEYGRLRQSALSATRGPWAAENDGRKDPSGAAAMPTIFLDGEQPVARATARYERWLSEQRLSAAARRSYRR